MGKLHTLKRAIEREPEKWFFTGKSFALSVKKKKPIDFMWKRSVGATFYDGEWHPKPYWRKYNGFATKVLKDIGYTDFVS